jgi:uncharacterized phage protein gp47/JayE
MAFLTKTEFQIAEDIFLLLQQNTNITRFSPGAKARAITDIVKQVLGEAYAEIDLALAKAFISAASGQFLDLMGILLAEPRYAWSSSSVDESMQTLKFYVDSGTFGGINAGNNIDLPRNSIISTKPAGAGIAYRLLSALTLSASSDYGWASAEASNPGADYNVGANELIYHDFTSYTDYLNETLKVTNIHPITNGKDFESDNNYRYRLTLKVLDAEAANETALRLAALSVPGVADVVMKKNYRGIGTYGIIVKSTMPTASTILIDNVTQRVLRKGGLGSIAFVTAQKEVGYALKTRVWYRKRLTTDQLDDIEMTMENTVRDYVNGLDLYEPLLVDRMMGSLYEISTAIDGFGTRANAIDESWIYKPSQLEDNRRPQRLIGDYTPVTDDERVIIEPTLSSPIIFERKYGNRPVS